MKHFFLLIHSLLFITFVALGQNSTTSKTGYSSVFDSKLVPFVKLDSFQIKNIVEGEISNFMCYQNASENIVKITYCVGNEQDLKNKKKESNTLTGSIKVRKIIIGLLSIHPLKVLQMIIDL
jgi:hypothetical protein